MHKPFIYSVFIALKKVGHMAVSQAEPEVGSAGGYGCHAGSVRAAGGVVWVHDGGGQVGVGLRSRTSDRMGRSLAHTHQEHG